MLTLFFIAVVIVGSISKLLSHSDYDEDIDFEYEEKMSKLENDPMMMASIQNYAE